MTINRRAFLGGFSEIGAMGAVSLMMGTAARPTPAAAATTGPLKGPYLDLTTGLGTKIASIRMQADLDPSKEKTGWFKGYVMAVRDGQRTQDIFGFEGLSTSRLKILEDGSYVKMLREVGLYTDLESGNVLENWYNPFNNQEVKVVPIANDPFNFVFTEYAQGGSMDAGRSTSREPYLLPWKQRGEWLELEVHEHLRYPNLLTPEKWPRESSGPDIISSEFAATHVRAEDMQNPELTGIRTFGTWNRRTPWLPWMLMGQTPGFCMYATFYGGGDDLEEVHSRKVLDYVEKHYPKYFTAPTDWDGTPNRSSLENYALEQTPAPPK